MSCLWVGRASVLLACTTLQVHALPGTTAMVPTECGPVKGAVTNGVAVFKSIPFAHAARWEVPHDLPSTGSCWTSTYFDATSYGPQCVTLFTPRAGSEDCLSLTVWSSNATAGAAAAVMVYFHGGDLTLGSATTDFALLARDGLVLVDVSYRLHALGYLSLPALAAADPRGTSGNLGVLDQIESLRWVQRNIEAFGGDPARVTIFGQSSGGTSVLALLASPGALGLYQRAMALSASPNVSAALDSQQAQHSHIAQAAGCCELSDGTCMRPNASAARATRTCLLALSTSALVRAVPTGDDHGPSTLESPSWSMGNIFNVPTHADGLRMPALLAVDGTTLAAPPLAALARPLHDVPLVLSSMAQEPGADPGNHFNASGLSPAAFAAQLGLYFDGFMGAGFGRQLAGLYANETAVSAQLAFDSIAADIGVTCGTLVLAGAAADAFSSPVYSLVNAVRGRTERVGAFHGRDLATATRDPGRQGRRLRAWWKEFATTGAVREWTAATSTTTPGERRATNVLLDDAVDVRRDWRGEACRMWREGGAGPEFWWSN